VHLADGVLQSPALLIGLDVAGIGAVTLALKKRFADSDASGPSTVYTGTLAAFVLAAQMINVPLVPGASAHAIGAGLLTLMLGPAHAILALLAVLTAQAFLFADGGITVLPFNALNIAVLPVFAVTICRRWLGEGPRRLMLAGLFGTLLGNLAGAASLGLALVWGSSAPAGLTFSWLLGVQGLAGLIEGALTAAAVWQLTRKAPQLIAGAERSSLTGVGWAAAALVVALVLVPFASSTPDALERVLAFVHVP